MANCTKKFLILLFFLINALKLTDILSNCLDVSLAGNNESGIYEITVLGRDEKNKVYCDLETDGGGWLVI